MSNCGALPEQGIAPGLGIWRGLERVKRARRTGAKKTGGNSSVADDWLKDVSPMVWRRVQVPSTMTLREFHGVLQVAMGWESIHLYQFIIHTARYGSWETSARSPDIRLGDLKLRKGSRFLYEYDLNIPWAHEVRLEGRRPVGAEFRHPVCTGGVGNCPQEDCGGPEGWM
ncbi:plasmid pRiA4b ORF-3 family protein [Manganibacter manganicus]|uniref:plasmid pRiA4b ORF-3 family protein n=1 Tax=Manganibacter manganicus TaxID=1873176 RepID=UPI001FD99601|nr:plasmid pRiA4b ORF-3 family protein [Pseudaminobacter manganicus]